MTGALQRYLNGAVPSTPTVQAMNPESQYPSRP